MLADKDRAYIKGQKYTLLSNKENLTLDGRRTLKKLLAANKRLNTAYLLKESDSLTFFLIATACVSYFHARVRPLRPNQVWFAAGRTIPARNDRESWG